MKKTDTAVTDWKKIADAWYEPTVGGALTIPGQGSNRWTQELADAYKRSSDYAYASPDLADYKAGSDDGFGKALGAAGIGAGLVALGALLFKK